MQVKRKKILPLKSYHIEGRKNIDSNDYNVHLFKDSNAIKNQFIIVISKDLKKEDNVVNSNNIVSMIYFSSQDDLKESIKYIGEAAKNIWKLDRQFFDMDFINFIKNSIEHLNFDLWVSPNVSSFVTPEMKAQKLKDKEQKADAFKNLSDEHRDVLSVKPIVLLDTLSKLGFIRILKTSPNGSDEIKYKFEFSDKFSHGNTSFNISVKKHSALNDFSSDVFNDFSNNKNRELGLGSIGLMAHLGEFGLFSDFNNKSSEEKKEFSLNYLVDNIIPHVPENEKVTPNMNFSTINFDQKTVTFQPIERNDSRSNESIQLLSDFLKYRCLDSELINLFIKENIIIAGDFYNSRIKDDFDNDGNKKPNYAYTGVPMFRLRSGFKNNFSGAERFTIKRTPNSPKPFEYDKLNIGSLNGRFFSFGEYEKPKKAIFHEAIIDAASSYSLIKLGGENPDNYKYISTQGSSHLKGFCLKHLGFWTHIDKSNNEEKIVTKAGYINKTLKPLSMESKAELKEKLGDKKLVFCSYNKDLSKSTEYKLNMLKEFFSSVDIVDYKKRTDVDLKSFDDDNTILVDNDNFYEFVESIKLNFEFNKDLKKTELKTFYTRENLVDLDDKSKARIRNKIVKFLGTDEIVFCLDNDHAGLKLLPVFTEMQRHFGMKVSYMIPNDFKYEMFSGLNLDNFMETYEKFVSNNKYDDAYQLLGKYISQKPIVDNNDVLKEYYKLLQTDKVKAQELIDYKMKQLKINIGYENPSLKKKSSIKPK